MDKFVFKSTGVEVGIQRISPLLIIEVQKRNPAPEPPMNEVDYGDGRKVMEPNPADPQYVRRLQEHSQVVEMKIRRLLIRLGVVYTLTEEDRAKVARVLEMWQEVFQDQLNQSMTELELFISYVAMGSAEDFEAFTEAVLSRSTPTPKSNTGGN